MNEQKSRREEKGKVSKIESEFEPKNRNDREMMFGSEEMNKTGRLTDRQKQERR